MRFYLLPLLSIVAITASAQVKTSAYTKFGKITVEDLQRKVYPIDSGANAVVLSDIGEAAIEGNNKGWFSINFKRHRVVHILNKNGYDEAAMEIHLYTRNGTEEKLDNLKAVTYNLENGKIVETKLDKSSLFKEQLSENWVARKFTMPAVKEGSIVEIQYTVTSDFIDVLDPWEFQGSAPSLWSEYNLSVPQFFTYAFLSHGYHGMYINERSNRTESFTVRDTRGAGASDVFNFNSGVTDYRWVMKDVEGIKDEGYTSALKNHLSAIDFQLTSYNEPLTPQNFRSSWTQVAKELLESDRFGKNLETNNNWLKDELKDVIAGAKDDKEKAHRIFAYVRDNFSCSNSRGIYLSQPLKNVFRSKKGNTSDINILLTAMLRSADFTAEPVVLSTTDHGYVIETSPMISAFNYVVSKLKLGEEDIFLDASRPGLGFAKLPAECFNGHARVVNEQATPVYLKADMVKEIENTSLFIINGEKGELVGNMNQNKGYFNSLDIRNKIREKGEENFFKDVEKAFGSDVKITSPKVDSLKNQDNPVSLHYDIELPAFTDDIVYFSPLFGESYKKNPFKSAERYFPVEMPYTSDEIYNLTFEVPNGYVVDELPKQIAAKMDEEGSAYFEYRISLSGSTISLRSRLKIDKTLFLPNEYEMLREFFNIVVSKQNEQIVFKKKK
jgi:hypothetical protein